MWVANVSNPGTHSPMEMTETLKSFTVPDYIVDALEPHPGALEMFGNWNDDGRLS